MHAIHAPDRSCRGLQILLVEDEPLIAITLADDLRDLGHAVTVLGDGKAALELLHQRRFDALVTDLRLPGAHGSQVVRVARELRHAARILVISAFIADRNGELQQLGADAVLHKPFANQRVIDWLAAG